MALSVIENKQTFFFGVAVFVAGCTCSVGVRETGAALLVLGESAVCFVTGAAREGAGVGCDCVWKATFCITGGCGGTGCFGGNMAISFEKRKYSSSSTCSHVSIMLVVHVTSVCVNKLRRLLETRLGA